MYIHQYVNANTEIDTPSLMREKFKQTSHSKNFCRKVYLGKKSQEKEQVLDWPLYFTQNNCWVNQLMLLKVWHLI